MMMTSAQVVKMSVYVTTNSPSKDYTDLDDHTSPAYDVTPGFKPLIKIAFVCNSWLTCEV